MTASMTVEWRNKTRYIDEAAIKADGRERGVTIEFQGRTMTITGPRRKLRQLKSEFGPDYVTSRITE